MGWGEAVLYAIGVLAGVVGVGCVLFGFAVLCISLGPISLVIIGGIAATIFIIAAVIRKYGEGLL